MNIVEILAIGAGVFLLVKNLGSKESALEKPAEPDTAKYNAPDYSTDSDQALIDSWKNAPGINNVLGGRYYDVSGNLYRGVGNSYWFATDVMSWMMYDATSNQFLPLSAAPWQVEVNQPVEEVIMIAPANTGTDTKTQQPVTQDQVVETTIETGGSPDEPEIIAPPAEAPKPYWPPASGRYLVTGVGYSSTFVGDNPVMQLCTWTINAYRAADMEEFALTLGGLKIPVHPRGIYSLAELNALVVRKVYDASMFQHYVSVLAKGMNSLNQWNSGILENYFKWPTPGADHVDNTYGTGIYVYFDTPDQFWAVVKGIVFSVLGTLPDWRTYGAL
jgi:hypothetical protein